MNLAFGRESTGKLLYVQYVDQNFEKVNEIPDALRKDFILDVKFSDINYTHYASTTRDSNIDILKSVLSDKIVNVEVYTCPMEGYPKIIPHAFTVFQTQDKDNQVMWWSFDKNGHHVVLQQSRNKMDVIEKIYDDETKETMERPEPVEQKKTAEANRSLESLLRILWDTFQLGESYHLFLSNCWHFASFVFKRTNSEGKQWDPPISFKLLKCLKMRFVRIIEQHGHDEASIQISSNEKGFLRLALLENMQSEDFRRLTSTIESINGMDEQGYTLLEWAEAFSRNDIKNYLIRDKGVQSTVDEGLFRRNVFFIALEYVQSNNFSVLKPLDETYINDVKNNTEDTALHLAMRGGKWGIVKEIFDKQKSNINSINSSKETPLHLAAQLQKCEIDVFQQFLNEAKTDIINKVDAKGYAPLHWAIHARSLDKIDEMLKKGAQVDLAINDNQGLSPLHLAVQRWSNSPDGRINKIFKLLVENHLAYIQAEDNKGNSVLNTAIQLKSAKFAELLLEKGADTSAKNGTTPLHLAVQWPECPEKLLKNILQKSTTDIEVRIDGGRTALHCALESQSTIACKVLLRECCVTACCVAAGIDFKALVNANTEENVSALHLAAKWVNIEAKLFKKILKNTSDINKTDKRGRTPLHYALMFKSVIATEQLLKQGATVNAGAQAYNEYTALHLAAYFWSAIPLKIFEDILNNKENDINVQDKYGRTALHCAILSKSLNLVKKLLERKALNTSIVTNEDYYTVLHMVAIHWPAIPIELFGLLLNHCNIQTIMAQDSRGQTALTFLTTESNLLINELQSRMANQTDLN